MSLPPELFRRLPWSPQLMERANSIARAARPKLASHDRESLNRHRDRRKARLQMCNPRAMRFRIGHAHTRERQVRTKSPRLARKVLCHTLIFKPRL
ncbi:hypothetical protein BH18ACI2_BH18ACI2_04540 [soil metagenome]